MTIYEILEGLGVEYLDGGGNHHCRPGWVQLDCPWCRTVGKYHLGYCLAGGFFACWRCGGHNPFATLLELGASRDDTKAFCDEKDYLPGEARKLTSLVLKEPPGRGPLKRAHKEYLRDRGFDPDKLVKLWGIEGMGPIGNLAWRIYIPIIWNDQKVSWTTRSIGDKVERRYISARLDESKENIKTLIYGIDYCLHSIIVVEGPTDVWNIGPGAGGLFGTAYTEAQVAKLARVPHRFIAFDNSPTAQRRARKLARELSSYPGETQNIQIDAADPGSAPRKEIKLLRKLAKLQ